MQFSCLRPIMDSSLHVLINNFIGINDPLLFFSYIFWAGIGVLLSLLLHAAQRDTSNQEKPANFNWKFLLLDNAKRIATSFILILVAIRFSQPLIGLEQNDFTAFIIGLSSDNLGKLLQNKIVKLRSKIE